MHRMGKIRFEAATGLIRGGRTTQEDSVLCDVPQGGGAGILVLADGLGGHAGGALASRLAVTTALREVVAQRDAEGRLLGSIPDVLLAAAHAANAAVLERAAQAPELDGMGTTLIVAVVQDDTLHWLSVGDSALYLMRNGTLTKLNETHSLAPHLDLLVEVGEMSAEDAVDHPSRNCLTSALGTQKIERIDCPEASRALLPRDRIIAASDGLLTLQPSEIAGILAHAPAGASPAHCVERLLEAVDLAGDDEQDNTSIAFLQIEAAQQSGSARGIVPLFAWMRNAMRGSAAAARAALSPVRARPE